MQGLVFNVAARKPAKLNQAHWLNIIPVIRSSTALGYQQIRKQELRSLKNLNLRLPLRTIYCKTFFLVFISLDNGPETKDLLKMKV